jgi:hypothetical protein
LLKFSQAKPSHWRLKYVARDSKEELPSELPDDREVLSVLSKIGGILVVAFGDLGLCGHSGVHRPTTWLDWNNKGLAGACNINWLLVW